MHGWHLSRLSFETSAVTLTLNLIVLKWVSFSFSILDGSRILRVTCMNEETQKKKKAKLKTKKHNRKTHQQQQQHAIATGSRRPFRSPSPFYPSFTETPNRTFFVKFLRGASGCFDMQEPIAWHQCAIYLILVVLMGCNLHSHLMTFVKGTVRKACVEGLGHENDKKNENVMPTWKQTLSDVTKNKTEQKHFLSRSLTICEEWPFSFALENANHHTANFRIYI